MKGYSVVLILAFFYGGVEVFGLDKLPFWKSNWMVPYWAFVTTVFVVLSYFVERRADRAVTLGSFGAFVVADAGYWFIEAFPRYPFPVYNWWAEWWPWNSIWQGHLIGEPMPLLGIPYYYLILTMILATSWVIITKRRSP